MEWNKDFADNYIRVYGNRFSQEVTDKQASFIASLLPPGAKVADVPCGWGRHAEALAKLGFKVHGVDLYNTPRESSNGVTYEVADMREWRGSGFDAVLSLFSSFGYFSHEENKKVLGNAVASLKSGGVFILDTNNPVATHNELKTNNWELRGDGWRTIFDPTTNIETVYYTVDGKEISGSWRNYSLNEFEDMLAVNSCRVEKIYGSYNGSPYSDTSRRLIIVARKS